jgi:membrane-associated phospholipid phosphatase
VRYPELAELYPRYPYLAENISRSSFPSQSTAVYSVVAAGMYSLHRAGGSALWFVVAALVALPRMYLGGHYPSDIVAGFLLGLVGYLIVVRGFEARVVRPLDRVAERRAFGRLARDGLVFIWIWQVAVGFREVIWVRDAIRELIRAWL